MAQTRPELQGYDTEQIEMMGENCILVDENDKIIGKDSKVNCHIGNGKLHRAFSVLLFNNSKARAKCTARVVFPVPPFC